MGKKSGRLEQAIIDLIEAYAELEAGAEEKYADDEESYASTMIEGLETSIESAIDEGDISTGQFAAMLANMSEALEQLDPSAFESDEEDDDDADVDPSEMEEIDDDDLELDYEEEDEDED